MKRQKLFVIQKKNGDSWEDQKPKAVTFPAAEAVVRGLMINEQGEYRVVSRLIEEEVVREYANLS